jgi:hypothetical protein
MNCPRCGAKIPDSVAQCPFCGQEQEIHFTRRFLSYGKISLTFAFISIIMIIVVLFLFLLLTSGAFGFAQFLSNIILLFSTLSIILGSIAFFGKTKDVLGLVGMFLGICLLAVLTIGLSLASLIVFKSSVHLLSNPLVFL